MFQVTVTSTARKQMKVHEMSLSALLDILLHGTHTQLANGKWLAVGKQALNTAQCQYTLTCAPEKTFTIKTVGLIPSSQAAQNAKSKNWNKRFVQTANTSAIP